MSFWCCGRQRGRLRLTLKIVLRELEMCGSDFAVLEALLHKGPLPINEIGKKVLLTSGSITVAVDRLESKSWSSDMHPALTGGRGLCT